jgi:CelD/BcsL family acetyltransferase involved in cellulose biosynthesis
MRSSMGAVRAAVTAPYERLHDDSVAAKVAVETPSKTLTGAKIALYDNLSAVEYLWRRLEQNADCTVFQTYDYLAAWQKHIGARDRGRPVIAVVSHEGNTLAIFPLAVSGRFVRRLTWLGQELCDYSAPLLAPDFPRIVTSHFPALWSEIGELMQRDPRRRHDLVDFRKMPETVGAQRNPFLALPVSQNASSAHLATLAGDWEAFYTAKRSPSTRRRDRTKHAKLAEHGDLRLVTAETNDEKAQTFDTLIRQKSAALKRMGVEDFFARPGVRDFYLELATSPRSPDLVHLSRLDVGPVMASVNLGLQHRGRYHYILASYDDDGIISRFGPGSAHLRNLIARAIELGYREFDFTIGDERYKFDWADIETKLYDLLAPVSFRGWLPAVALRALAKLKRTIKQNPSLWNAFQQVRTRVLGAR